MVNTQQDCALANCIHKISKSKCSGLRSRLIGDGLAAYTRVLIPVPLGKQVHTGSIPVPLQLYPVEGAPALFLTGTPFQG